LLKKFNILLILFLLIFQSCGLRDDEDPVTARTTFIPPTTPDLVVFNLKSSIIEKDLNNFMKCLIDTAFNPRKYTYSADVVSQSQYPIFRFWTIGNEYSYYRNLLTVTNPQTYSDVIFTDVTWNIVADTAIFDAKYELLFEHNKTGAPKRCLGALRFVMSVDTRNLWSVHNWSDFKNTSTDTTWSVLKANFAN